MTKILLQNDRIIFDGHADSIQECETITLLCDSLTNNPNFKTIRYESGYAEFEKVGKAEKLMFAIGDITVNFDSNITKVECIAKNWEWTTSGSSLEVSGVQDGTSYLFNVTFATGYILNTVSANFNSDGSTISAQNDSSFTITAGSGASFTITLTSKQGGSSQKSYDLSSSSKWAALSDGEPTVQIVAKGTGYRDSAKSTSVTVTKGTTGETWVLNETLNISGTNIYNNIEMTYSGQTRAYPIKSLKMYEFSDGPAGNAFEIIAEEETEYDDANSKYYLYTTAGGNSGWDKNNGVKFNIWTFSIAPTGDLLSWLQANGTKQGGAALINFTIDGTLYQAEEGMTWQQWVDSSYNTGGYIVYNNIITTVPPAGGSRVTTDRAYNNEVSPTDIITETAYYEGQAN